MPVHLINGTLGFYLEDTGIGGGGTYGTRLMDGTPANTITYPFGEYFKAFPIPIEKPAFVDRALFTSFDYGNLKPGAKNVEFLLEYMLMEGLGLYFPLGKEAKSGSSPDITHTLTPIAVTDTLELPSRTTHIDCPSLTTDKIIDIPGCITQQVDLGGTAKQPGIFVKEKIVAQRITDENATHDINGVASAGSEDDAQNFSADPVYGDNTGLAVGDFYYLNDFTHETNSFMADMVSWNININNELIPRRANRAGTDNYGRTINNYVGGWYLKQRRYNITLSMLITDATKVLWDRMQTGTLSNDLIFEFVRKRASDSNADSITITFDATTCPVIDITGLAAFSLGNDQVWTFVLQPKTLVSAVVIDDVNEYQELHE